jgi:pimeloyl-ACP methyl ester carboxylesterase
MLVHGFGGDSGVWDRVQAGLARDHTVVCVDLPGFRDAAMPPERDGSADFLAIGASLGALARELGLQSGILVGHSMGAHLAALAVLQHPSAFRGWVVVDQSLRCGPPMAPDAWRRLEADPEGFFGNFLGAQARGAAQKRSVVQKALAMEARALASYLRHLGTDDLGLARIDLPLAVCTASPPPADLLAWREVRAYPVTGSVRFAWFPACGHWIMVDEPDAFASSLRAFEAWLDSGMCPP